MTDHASDWTVSQWTILRSRERSRLKYTFNNHARINCSIKACIMDLCQIIIQIRGFMGYNC